MARKKYEVVGGTVTTAAALNLLNRPLSPGPAINDAQRETLQAVAALEPGWLANDQEPMAVASLLEAQGWRVETDSWEEELELPLSAALLQRWFAPGAPYRRQLEEQRGDATTREVEQLLQTLEGQRLPQRLQHRLLRCRLSDTQAKAPDQPGR